jgi:hypothetical protein
MLFYILNPLQHTKRIQCDKLINYELTKLLISETSYKNKSLMVEEVNSCVITDTL